MNARQTTGVARLLEVAKAWEAQVVIPHCAVCSRPCCALTDVVLDLGEREATALYAIQKGKPLPSALRRRGKRFYAHGSPCPAYDVGGHRCTVYDTPKKPQGCSDFPIYGDGDVVTIDLRCEAVAQHQEAFEAALVDVLDRVLDRVLDAGVDDGHDVSLVVSVDSAHPDTFVSYGLEITPPHEKPG